MLKPSDINYIDDEVIKAYTASAGTFRKRFTLEAAAAARAEAANSLGYLEV